MKVFSLLIHVRASSSQHHGAAQRSSSRHLRHDNCSCPPDQLISHVLSWTKTYIIKKCRAFWDVGMSIGSGGMFEQQKRRKFCCKTSRLNCNALRSNAQIQPWVDERKSLEVPELKKTAFCFLKLLKMSAESHHLYSISKHWLCKLLGRKYLG